MFKVFQNHSVNLDFKALIVKLVIADIFKTVSQSLHCSHIVACYPMRFMLIFFCRLSVCNSTREHLLLLLFYPFGKNILYDVTLSMSVIRLA